MDLNELDDRLDNLESDIRQMKSLTGEMEIKIQELQNEAEAIRDELRDKAIEDDGPDDREDLWPGGGTGDSETQNEEAVA